MVLNESGQAVTSEAPAVAQGDGDGGAAEPQAAEATPQEIVVTITLGADGNVRVGGPSDIRTVLRLLHEGTDIVVSRLAESAVLGRLMRKAAEGPGIVKAGIADTLAFTKRG